MSYENMESNGDYENNSNASPAATSIQRKSSYRNLLSQVEDLEEKNELGLQTATDVGNVLKQLNKLEKEFSIQHRVDHDQTDETLLDCMVLSSSSSILVKCINAVDISMATYDPTEFCDKLCEELRDEDEQFRPSDFLKLLSEARNIIPEIPPYEYVYGTYDLNQIPVPKQKKVINRDPKEKLTKKEPEKVVDLGKEEEGIDEIVKGLYQVLLEEYTKNGEQPIKYYDYVIDTSDFSSTVENMFYCSFLIRDGKAKLDLDDTTPTIKPVAKRELKQFRSEGCSNAQIITSISMNEWEGYKKEGFLQKHKRLTQIAEET